MKREHLQGLLLGTIVIVAGLGGFFITEKVILIYEYGFFETFRKGIRFVESEPYIITSEGDTFTRYHNLFYFIFPIIPFFPLFLLQGIILVMTGVLKLPEEGESPTDLKGTDLKGADI